MCLGVQGSIAGIRTGSAGDLGKPVDRGSKPVAVTADRMVIGTKMKMSCRRCKNCRLADWVADAGSKMKKKTLMMTADSHVVDKEVPTSIHRW